MTIEPWLLAAGVLFVLGHVVILLFFYRLRQGGGRSSSTSEAETVQCRECGAENDGQYQFCRECAAELPGGTTVDGDGNAPESRVL